MFDSCFLSRRASNCFERPSTISSLAPDDDISMGWNGWKDVTPLLIHWSCVFLALTHRYVVIKLGHHWMRQWLIAWHTESLQEPFMIYRHMVLWHSLESSFKGNAKYTNSENVKYYLFEIIFASLLRLPLCQWSIPWDTGKIDRLEPVLLSWRLWVTLACI